MYSCQQIAASSTMTGIITMIHQTSSILQSLGIITTQANINT